MTHFKMIRCILILSAMLMLPLPVTAASDTAPENLNLRKEFSNPGNAGSASIPSTELASSVKSAVTAVLMRLRGASEAAVEKQLSVRSSGLLKPESAFTYDGFTVESADLLHYSKADGAPLGRNLAGYLRFVDAFGRRANALFELRYDIAKEGIDLKNGFVAPIMPPNATMIMAIVPTQALTEAGDSETTFAKFQSLVRDSAIPINDAAAVPSSKDDYTIVVFFMDRLAPNSQVEVLVSKKQDGLDGYGEATAYRSFNNNWVVAAIPGRLALSDDKVFWIKALYRDQKNGAPSLIGLFSTAPGPVKQN